MSDTSTRLKRTGEIFLIPLNQVVVDEEVNNGRIDFGNLEELADSIEENGLRVPLLVKKVRGEENYVLIQGKRRLKAYELLVARGVDIAGVKCMLAPPAYSVENSLFDQIIMNDGKPYSSLEQGVVFAQLVERGYSVKEISKKIGKSVTHISNCIEITSLPKKVRDMISAGSVSGLTAVELSKVVSSEEELVEKLQEAVCSAPVSAEGTTKKVTKKNVKQIASASPFKKMAEINVVLKEGEITNERAYSVFWCHHQ